MNIFNISFEFSNILYLTLYLFVQTKTYIVCVGMIQFLWPHPVPDEIRIWLQIETVSARRKVWTGEDETFLLGALWSSWARRIRQSAATRWGRPWGRWQPSPWARWSGPRWRGGTLEEVTAAGWSTARSRLIQEPKWKKHLVGIEPKSRQYLGILARGQDTGRW